LFSDKNGERVIYTSEAGHSTIPHVIFSDKKDNRINKKVLKTIVEHYEKLGQKAITEHIVSGTGISNVYHAIKDGIIPTDKNKRVSAENIEEMAARGNSVALKTFDMFNAYLGAHTGTMVATTKASTVFFCGGLMASSWVLFKLNDTPYFMEQFIPRSGLTDAMNRVSIYASTYRDMSTLGAVVYAKEIIQKQKGSKQKNRNKQDFLQKLYCLQLLIDNNYPKARKSMQRVVRAVQQMQSEKSVKTRG
jgi:glucokinase